jgi:hypothetical protein
MDLESKKYSADPTTVTNTLFEAVGRNYMSLPLVTGAEGYAVATRH